MWIKNEQGDLINLSYVETITIERKPKKNSFIVLAGVSNIIKTFSDEKEAEKFINDLLDKLNYMRLK